MSSTRIKKNIIKKLKEGGKNSEEIYLAYRPRQRRGRAISWHLANVLDLTPKRIEFNEISKKPSMRL